jgi:ABC-type antimicrobial peptide transport system permease subunit
LILAMFHLRYLAAELRRRRGRTILTALGLGVGVGLVITVTALSAGLDDAQDEILEPLTGVGTDMTVNRPISFDEGEATAGAEPGAGLSAKEQKQLEKENGGPGLDFSRMGDPGEKFETDRFISTDLSFPAKEAKRVAATQGVEGVSAALTVDVLHLEGKIPDTSGGPVIQAGAPPGGGEQGGQIGFEPLTVTGIDAAQSDLGLVKADQIVDGRFLRPADRGTAIVSQSYADENGLGVGDTVKVASRKFEIAGISSAPLGGTSSDVYVPLSTLQKLSDREGRVNQLQVRAASVDDVGSVASAIEDEFSGSEVTTASDVADRVSGSLVSAQNLSDTLGTALAIVALGAAVGLATLLTLSSVSKRTRELGTLKALGWRQWPVVRQVSAESLAQGLLGGAAGIVIGLAGSALIGALNITLEASAGAEAATVAGPGIAMRGPGDQVVSGTSTVVLGAPVDGGLIALAVVLAVAGGLVAGAIGGVRAARLRPAVALRSVE